MNDVPKYLCLVGSVIYLALGFVEASYAALASSNTFLIGYFVLEALDDG